MCRPVCIVVYPSSFRSFLKDAVVSLYPVISFQRYLSFCPFFDGATWAGSEGETLANQRKRW